MKKIRLGFKLLLFLFCLLVCCPQQSSAAQAADFFFTYRVEGNAVTVTGYYGDGAEIVVPAEIDGLPVKALAAETFAQCPHLSSVTVPSQIVTLPEGVFPTEEGFTVIAPADSAASAYCKERGIACIPREESETAQVFTAAATGKFRDVDDGAWYAPYIYDLVAKGIVQGVSADAFAPKAQVTRAEFVMMLSNAAGLTKEQRAAYRERQVFRDVSPSAWYAPSVHWAAERGIVKGVGGDRFAPNGKISREEMATMLDRYHGAFGAKPLPALVAETRFADGGKIASWGLESVRAIQMAGIVEGRGGYLFAPQGLATRGEAAKIVSLYSGLPQSGGIKGLVFGLGESVYWQDGLRKEGKEDIVSQGDTVFIPAAVYGEAIGYEVEAAADAVTLRGPGNGASLTFTAGSKQAKAKDGGLVELPAAPYVSGQNVFMIPGGAVAAYFGDVFELRSGEGAVILRLRDAAVTDASLWLKGLAWEKEVRGLEESKLRVEQKTFGKSGQGRDLTYTAMYRPGYKKTVVFVFEQHGFEDQYNRDGQLLVNAANALIAHFSRESADLSDCRLIVVTSANPDGLAEGWTNNGPGRCTVQGAVDMNRDWPTGNYVSRHEARYRTLAPLSCDETRNLHNLIVSLRPAVLIDFHGWLNGTYGDAELAGIFQKAMGLPPKTLFARSMGLEANDVSNLADAEIAEAIAAGLVGFSGYLAGWGKEQGYQSALVEFAFNKNGISTGPLIAATNAVLQKTR